VPLDVKSLRKLFRHLGEFHDLVVETGTDTLTYEGEEWSYYDLEYLFTETQSGRLPVRQAQAIKWFLVAQLREEDVAVKMGLKPTNPIGMYATSGLEKLVLWIETGQLSRFRPESTDGSDEVWRLGGARRRGKYPDQGKSGRSHVA
jgi:hypothetical protein